MQKLAAVCLAALTTACTAEAPSAPPNAQPLQAPKSPYLDYTGRPDVLAGGVRMIPIATPKGTFKVWTKRIGNNPRVKVLLLHGGPGVTHEYFEAFDSYLPAEGIEYYYYDQLGSVLQRPAGDVGWHARTATLRGRGGAGPAGARPPQ